MKIKSYAVLLPFFLAVPGGIESATSEVLFQAQTPTEWEAACSATERFKNDCVTELLGIAKDQTKADADRMSAILLLGKFGSRQATNYCLDNIRLSFPSLSSGFIINPEDTYNQHACFLVLKQSIQHDHRVCSEVLQWLQTFRHDEDLRLVSQVVRLQLNRRFIHEWIKDELSKRPMPSYEKNLQFLDLWIPQ